MNATAQTTVRQVARDSCFRSTATLGSSYEDLLSKEGTVHKENAPNLHDSDFPCRTCNNSSIAIAIVPSLLWMRPENLKQVG